MLPNDIATALALAHTFFLKFFYNNSLLICQLADFTTFSTTPLRIHEPSSRPGQVDTFSAAGLGYVLYIQFPLAITDGKNPELSVRYTRYFHPLLYSSSGRLKDISLIHRTVRNLPRYPRPGICPYLQHSEQPG